MHVSLNNSVTRPYLDNLRHVFVHTFDMVGHLVKTLPVRFFKYGLVTELLRETCKGGLILSILAAYVPGNLNGKEVKIPEAIPLPVNFAGTKGLCNLAGSNLKLLLYEPEISKAFINFTSAATRPSFFWYNNDSGHYGPFRVTYPIGQDR